jgi:DNA-binding response OmpR family regulator
MTEAKTIFIIEDDTSLQGLLRETFEKHGFFVQSASDGEEAVEKLSRTIPDLILLDIVIPKKTGLDVLKELRKQESLKNTPVVLLTNLEGAESVEKALSMGATTYLVKSNYSLQEITEKVISLM